jgi:hypothetical protein
MIQQQKKPDTIACEQRTDFTNPYQGRLSDETILEQPRFLAAGSNPVIPTIVDNYQVKPCRYLVVCRVLQFSPNID